MAENMQKKSSKDDHQNMPKEILDLSALAESLELSWSEKVFELVKSLNCFQSGPTVDQCVPFILDNVQIGLITPDVLKRLESYHEVFMIVRDLLSSKVKFVTMALNLSDCKSRSQKIACVMREWKDHKLFLTLDGWRNETYAIKEKYSSETLLEVERAATCLFGFRTYGVHVNGYVRNDCGDVYMWIARRSKEKQTFPGKLDNTVAGGISSEDEGVLKTVIRECKEEAGISERMSSTARPAGTLSYFYENELGLHPETQFVFDLELPRSFEPTNNDKEVSDFYLLPIKEVKELIATNEFKPNCALVLLDFFIRHGALDPDSEPNYIEFAQGCRRSLPY